MSFRLLLDEDIDLQLASALRNAGCDAVHVQEIERKGKSDSQQLEFAIKEKRAAFTHNRYDFVQLHNQYVKDSIEHFGIIVAKRCLFSVLYRRILLLMEEETPESIMNCLKFI